MTTMSNIQAFAIAWVPGYAERWESRLVTPPFIISALFQRVKESRNGWYTELTLTISGMALAFAIRRAFPVMATLLRISLLALSILHTSRLDLYRSTVTLQTFFNGLRPVVVT